MDLITYELWNSSLSQRSFQNIFLSLVALVFLLTNRVAIAQNLKSEMLQPSFLQSDEEVKEVINGQIYLVHKKNDKNAVVNEKLYFSDSQGNVIKTFNIFPSTAIQSATGELHASKKYLIIQRHYFEGKKQTTNGFLLNNSGDVLWNIPGKDLGGIIMSSDKDNTLMVVDAWKGHLKIYGVKGEEIEDKYFSNQNGEKFPEINSLDEEEDFSFNCKFSESGNYVCVSRSFPDVRGFKNEVTLLDSKGNVIFQDFDEQSRFGHVLNVLEDPQVVVLMGSTGGSRRVKKYDRYFGLDFTGKELWELDGEKYYIDPRDLKTEVVKIGNIEKKLNKNGNMTIKFRVSPSGQTINVKTGEIK